MAGDPAHDSGWDMEVTASDDTMIRHVIGRLLPLLALDKQKYLYFERRNSQIEVAPGLVKVVKKPVFDEVFAALKKAMPTISEEEVMKLGCYEVDDTIVNVFDSEDDEYNTFLVNVTREKEVVRDVAEYHLYMRMSWVDYEQLKEKISKVLA